MTMIFLLKLLIFISKLSKRRANSLFLVMLVLKHEWNVCTFIKYANHHLNCRTFFLLYYQPWMSYHKIWGCYISTQVNNLELYCACGQHLFVVITLSYQTTITFWFTQGTSSVFIKKWDKNNLWWFFYCFGLPTSFVIV